MALWLPTRCDARDDVRRAGSRGRGEERRGRDGGSAGWAVGAIGGRPGTITLYNVMCVMF